LFRRKSKRGSCQWGSWLTIRLEHTIISEPRFVSWKIEKVPYNRIAFWSWWKKEVTELREPKAVNEPSNACKAEERCSEIQEETHVDTHAVNFNDLVIYVWRP
jgi:hypothetical protein